MGSIKYDMLFTSPIVYLSIILAREYNSDLGVDHWTSVKIILRGLRKYFSVMEVIKRVRRKELCRCKIFYIDLYDSISRSGYILKVGAIS